MRTCDVEGCDRKHKGQGFCEAHRARFLRHGDPGPADIGRRTRPPATPCLVEGCDRPTDRQGLCNNHFSRVMRNGDVGPAAIRAYGHDELCAVDGCGKPYFANGYCSVHNARVVRHGDPLVVLHVKDRESYQAAHAHVVALYGKASEHECTRCGGWALHWAYDHGDPDERYDSRQPDRPYSLDPSHYQPMCSGCHQSFDKGGRDGA